MNREALPLIFAILIPVILVSLVLLYFYGYDVTRFFSEINLIYYIIIFPIALGSVGYALTHRIIPVRMGVKQSFHVIWRSLIN